MCTINESSPAVFIDSIWQHTVTHCSKSNPSLICESNEIEYQHILFAFGALFALGFCFDCFHSLIYIWSWHQAIDHNLSACKCVFGKLKVNQTKRNETRLVSVAVTRWSEKFFFLWFRVCLFDGFCWRISIVLSSFDLANILLYICAFKANNR